MVLDSRFHSSWVAWTRSKKLRAHNTALLILIKYYRDCLEVVG